MNHKRKYKIALLVLLISVITYTYLSDYYIKSYPKTDFNNTIESTANKDKLSIALNGNGISIGLYNIDGKIETNHNYYLKENESFEKFISISNSIPRKRTYKLLLFVDYKQTEYFVDDKPVLDFDFTMDANKTMEIPVKINSLAKGSHDILFVIAKDIDYKKRDEEFRKSTDLNHSLFIRRTIAVENDIAPEIIYTNGTYYNNDIGFSGILLSKSKEELMRWTFEECDKYTIDYSIHVGNGNEQKEQDFAIIMMYDWRQIPVIEETEAIFVKLNPKSRISIEAKLNIPQKRSLSDFTAIIIYNPYKKLNYETNNTETSIRIGIMN